MSVANVEQVIRKAVSDSEFRGMLLDSPEEALNEYDLTEQERALFDDLNEDRLQTAFADVESGQLEERISRSGSAWGRI